MLSSCYRMGERLWETDLKAIIFFNYKFRLITPDLKRVVAVNVRNHNQNISQRTYLIICSVCYSFMRIYSHSYPGITVVTSINYRSVLPRLSTNTSTIRIKLLGAISEPVLFATIGFPAGRGNCAVCPISPTIFAIDHPFLRYLRQMWPKGHSSAITFYFTSDRTLLRTIFIEIILSMIKSWFSQFNSEKINLICKC